MNTMCAYYEMKLFAVYGWCNELKRPWGGY